MNTYQGSCHCGAVRFEVDAMISKVMACNCSLCGKAGTLLIFVQKEGFRLLSGEDRLTDYRFNKKVIGHPFCAVCGVRAFSRSDDPKMAMMAVNARCLDGLDLDELPVEKFDGASL